MIGRDRRCYTAVLLFNSALLFLRDVPNSTSNNKLKHLKIFSGVEKQPHLLSKVSGLLFSRQAKLTKAVADFTAKLLGALLRKKSGPEFFGYSRLEVQRLLTLALQNSSERKARENAVKLFADDLLDGFALTRAGSYSAQSHSILYFRLVSAGFRRLPINEKQTGHAGTQKSTPKDRGVAKVSGLLFKRQAEPGIKIDLERAKSCRAYLRLQYAVYAFNHFVGHTKNSALSGADPWKVFSLPKSFL